MSSLGDLLLGNIPEPKDVQEKERQHEYKDNDNKQQIDIKTRIPERSPSQISNDDSNSRFAVREQKVFPERIEKKKPQELDDDRRSNASSTDDLVRELLDPNDRPRNVWHVVAEAAEKRSPDIRNDDRNLEDINAGSKEEKSEEELDDQNRGNLDDIRSSSHGHKANGDNIDDRARDRGSDGDVRKPGERSPERRSKTRNEKDRDNHDRRRSRDREERNRDRRKHSPDRHSKSRSKRSRHSDDEDDDRDLKRHRGGRSRRHGRRSRSRSPSRDSGSRRRRRRRSRSDSRSPNTKRDSKTILVMQLSPRIVSRDLEDFFEETGRVKEVRLIMDSKTRRHKGIAYIEFESASSAMKALALNGQKFHGLPLQIQSALSEKQGGEYQIAPSTSSYNGHHHLSSHTSSSHHTSSRSHYLPPNSYRVYMGSLNVGITDEMLRTIVEPFGMVHKVEVIKDRATGLSRGYAFVTFANEEDGQEAIRNLDGFELAGKCMRVSKSTEKSDR